MAAPTNRRRTADGTGVRVRVFLLAFTALAAGCAWGCGGGGKISSAINGASIEQGASSATLPKKIVFSFYTGTEYHNELHSINIDGSGDIKVSGGVDVKDFTASETSDKLFFTYASSTYVGRDEVFLSEMYSTSSGSSATVKLPCVATGTLTFVKWVPEISQLYYARRIYDDIENPAISIYRANEDCSSAELIYSSTDVNSYNSTFDVTADGDKVFFADSRHKNIYVYDISEATKTIFTSSEALSGGMISNPIISPDGSRILYYDDCDTGGFLCKNMYVRTIDGKKILSHYGNFTWGAAVYSVWAADNNRFAYFDDYSLYIMPVNNKLERQQIHKGSISKFYKLMDWSDDGALLLCTQVEIVSNIRTTDLLTMKPDGTNVKSVVSFRDTNTVPYYARFSR